MCVCSHAFVCVCVPASFVLSLSMTRDICRPQAEGAFHLSEIRSCTKRRKRGSERGGGGERGRGSEEVGGGRLHCLQLSLFENDLLELVTDFAQGHFAVNIPDL